MKSIACITGGDGFIGSHLSQELNKRSDHFEVFHWDRINPLELGGGKYVIHLAGRAHIMKETAKDPLDEFRKSNRDLCVQVAKQALKEKVEKFIFISSLSIFGRFTGGVIGDDSVPQPDDPYGLSKWEAEQGLIDLFSNQKETRCIILRLPMVYGAENKGNMLKFLNAAAGKIPLPLATANRKRSYVYIGNVCDAILKVLTDRVENRPIVSTYMISDGINMSSGELYSFVYRTLNRKEGLFAFPEWFMRFGGILGSFCERIFRISFPINRKTIARLFDEYRISSVSFSEDYSWSPPYTPEEGLNETVLWYKKKFLSQ